MRTARDLVSWFSGKLLKLLPPDVTFLVWNAPNSFSAGVPPRTPLGSLQRSPKPSSCFKGPTFKRRGGRRGDMGREPPCANSWVRLCTSFCVDSKRLNRKKYHSECVKIHRIWGTQAKIPAPHTLTYWGGEHILPTPYHTPIPIPIPYPPSRLRRRRCRAPHSWQTDRHFRLSVVSVRGVRSMGGRSAMFHRNLKGGG